MEVASTTSRLVEELDRRGRRCCTGGNGWMVHFGFEAYVIGFLGKEKKKRKQLRRCKQRHRDVRTSANSVHLFGLPPSVFLLLRPLEGKIGARPKVMRFDRSSFLHVCSSFYIYTFAPFLGSLRNEMVPRYIR